MARYIDADKVSEKLKRYLMPNVDIDGTVTVEVAERYLLELINKTPTADVVEVKYGEWLPIVIQDNYLEPPYCDTIKCSECGQEADVSFHDAKYCFECGAKMGGTPKERGGEK